MSDVRGRWPAIVDINLTQHSLELAGSTIPKTTNQHEPYSTDGSGKCRGVLNLQIAAPVLITTAATVRTIIRAM